MFYEWLTSGCLPPVILNEKDGSIMALVPAGEFEMREGNYYRLPKHKIHLDAYYISVYSVTNRQYYEFIHKTEHEINGLCEEEYLDHPVVNIRREDAIAYAKWAGCDLPTEAQWEKAARGPLGLKYPWGNEWDEDKCRHDKNRGKERTCKVWRYPQGVSGYGTYNQAGNTWEMCSPPDAEDRSAQVIRGGVSPYSLRDGPHGFRLVRIC